jgi:hypothetical protein
MEMQDVAVGMEFKLHPGTDLFMMGFRYGTVTKVGRIWVHAEVRHLDRKRTIRIAPDNMLPVE